MVITAITGASSGIGRSLARRLAAGGDAVAVLARRADRLDSLVAEIAERGGKAIAVPCDVTDRAQVQAAFARTQAELGPVERLIANAGGGERTDAATLNAEHVAAIVDLNLMGTVHCIEAVLPGMLSRGQGHIVGVSSLAARRGVPGGAAYSAAKAAMTNLLESLRLDLRGRGIDVTVLLPGFVRTDDGDGKSGRRKPFRLELEDATRRMEDAIRRRRGSLSFPLPLAAFATLATILPAPIYDRLLSSSGLGKQGLQQ